MCLATNGYDVSLSLLIDFVVQQLAVELGVSLTVSSDSVSTHAANLVLVQSTDPKSVKLVYQLGELALALRNFVEHGNETLQGDNVFVENRELWEAPTFHLDKLNRKANQQDWRNANSLPSQLEDQMARLKFDAGSLARCIRLMALVMHGANEQFGLSMGAPTS